MEPADEPGPSGSAQQGAQGMQEEGAGAQQGARFRSGLKDDCFDSESEPQPDAAGAQKPLSCMSMHCRLTACWACWQQLNTSSLMVRHAQA